MNVSRSLGEQTFRAGTEYDLVVFDRLAPQEQILLAELREDAGFYGILRPREGSGRTMRSVDRDTALLWLSTQAPGRLPFFVWEGVDHAVATRRVTQLVLDGVLEIELEGAFVSGARALPVLGPRENNRAAGRLNHLADEALRYGESLHLEDADELAARLYSYGAVPLSPTWTRRLRGSDEVLDFLAASPGTALHRDLASSFTHTPAQEDGAWMSWSKPSRRTPGPTDPIYKLYVSPQPEDLPRTFRELVQVLAGQDHLQFKVGASALGVLRPDKVVVYFESVELLQRAADLLATRLSSVAPQGVPFSAEIAGDGLLSWGMDPPRSARVLSWQDHDSWRLWVVRRLARAIVTAQSEPDGGAAASRYAVERLRLDGVDVDAWTPSNATWWLA